MYASVCKCKSFMWIIQLVFMDCDYELVFWKYHNIKMNFNYNAQAKSFHTAIYCTLQCTVTLMLYVLSVVSYTCLHSRMLFSVWCSALTLTDCQSNALTPSICSIVTTSMDVMSHVYGCKLWCYLLCSHLCSSVECVVCIHTVHGHRQVFWVRLTYNTCYIYIYAHACNIMHTFSCDKCYCPCDTFMCVDCSWTCALCTVLILITYIRYTIYTYHVSHCMLKPLWN